MKIQRLENQLFLERTEKSRLEQELSQARKDLIMGKAGPDRLLSHMFRFGRPQAHCVFFLRRLSRQASSPRWPPRRRPSRL